VSHVVLLGDSIFDNAAYTGGGPAVIAQLREILPRDWQATLGAIDGATTEDFSRQVSSIPRDATHVFVSLGGNDALGHVDLLDRPARSSAEVLAALADAAEGFEGRYRRAVASVVARDVPVTLCTIYDGNFPDATFQRLASTALAVFNDAILRVAFERALSVIDLRLVCNEPRDYANPIEPSSHGGAKIATAILRVFEERTVGRVARVFGA
jgi:hypothetical protein